MTVVAESTVEETKPVGPVAQPDYLNQVVAVETDLEPLALLKACKRIEALAGRQPRERWGPRELDIDILLYGDLEMATPELTIPHPEMGNRDFVMRELAEVAPDLDPA